MQVGLKIWRYNARTGERELQEFEIDAPEEATLLDCLDIVKDQHDGTLAYRKSCRMMICGSCGMRMDGAAVLACKVRMYDVAQAGHIPVISAMGNLPIVKDLVVDMDPFWEKFRSVDPYLQPGYDEPPDGKENLIRQERMNVIHKESLCINCGCCVSECNSMESDPHFTGPQALAKAMRFVGDPRDGHKLERLEALNGEHGIWECTRCYFCNERCPKGVDPARRDRQARRRVDEGGHRPRHGREAREVVRHLREDDGLAARDRARPEDAGRRRGDQADPLRARPGGQGKGAAAVPPHVAKNVREARRLHDLVREQGVSGYAGIVQGEHALAKLAHGHGSDESLEEIYERPGAFPRPYIAEEEGATTARSASRTTRAASPRCRRRSSTRRRRRSRRRSASSSSSSSRSRAAAPATSTRPSPTTTST